MFNTQLLSPISMPEKQAISKKVRNLFVKLGQNSLGMVLCTVWTLSTRYQSIGKLGSVAILDWRPYPCKPCKLGSPHITWIIWARQASSCHCLVSTSQSIHHQTCQSQAGPCAVVAAPRYQAVHQHVCTASLQPCFLTLYNGVIEAVPFPISCTARTGCVMPPFQAPWVMAHAHKLVHWVAPPPASLL